MKIRRGQKELAATDTTFGVSTRGHLRLARAPGTLRIDIINGEVLTALQVAVNEDDRPCFVGSMRASDVAVIMGLDNLMELTLNTGLFLGCGVGSGGYFENDCLAARAVY